MLLPLAFAVGAVLAQADLPNANLPGNSATLPNSNMPGSLPTDNPLTLPITDTSRDAEAQRAAAAEARARQERTDAAHEAQVQTQQIAVKALEESARARADSAAAKQPLRDALQQRQP
jgi:hypothetical protein